MSIDVIMSDAKTKTSQPPFGIPKGPESQGLVKKTSNNDTDIPLLNELKEWIQMANSTSTDCCELSDFKLPTQFKGYISEHKSDSACSWMLLPQHVPTFYQWYPVASRGNGVRWKVEYCNISELSPHYGKSGTMTCGCFGGGGEFCIEGQLAYEWGDESDSETDEKNQIKPQTAATDHGDVEDDDEESDDVDVPFTYVNPKAKDPLVRMDDSKSNGNQKSNPDAISNDMKPSS